MLGDRFYMAPTPKSIVMALLGSERALFNRLNRASSAARAWRGSIYPSFVRGRRLLLRALGRDLIGLGGRADVHSARRDDAARCRDYWFTPAEATASVDRLACCCPCSMRR